MRLSGKEREAFSVGLLPDGRMALVEKAARPHRFAVEGNADTAQPVRRYRHLSHLEPFTNEQGNEILRTLYKGVTLEDINV